MLLCVHDLFVNRIIPASAFHASNVAAPSFRGPFPCLKLPLIGIAFIIQGEKHLSNDEQPVLLTYYRKTQNDQDEKRIKKEFDKSACTAYCTSMNAITYTEARSNLANTIKRVCQDHNPIIITRKRENSVVMMSLEDYESLTETSYLLRSPKNARRLLNSIKELEEGRGRERSLLE